MITTSLPAISDKWKAFWPINELRPLAVLDYISYFLLIKKLDDEQLLMERSGKGNVNSYIYQQVHNDLRWHRFKHLDAKSLYTLFTKESGVIDFLHRYGQTDHLYSLYLKQPLLVTPTPNLLMNTLNIIKLFEAEDNKTQAAMYEYLLYKQAVAGQNGQVFAPANIVKLLVALMDPGADDLIWDPSVGNGSFLVNCVKYILNNKSGASVNNTIADDNFRGMDSDTVLLRIAAIDMMLNGIETPALEAVNIQDNFKLLGQTDLIFSNLYFKTSEAKLPDTGTVDNTNGKKEIVFLKLVLDNLKPGVRAAVIIPESLLYDTKEEIISVRRRMIDDHQLAGVISLTVTTSLFSGAAILIFNSSNSNVTDKIWFYKLKDVTAQANNEDVTYYENGNIAGFSGEDIEVITTWDNINKGTFQDTSDKSFFVTAESIRANHYNLSCKEYKSFAKAPDINSDNVTRSPVITVKNISSRPAPVVVKEETAPDIVKEEPALEEEKVKSRLTFFPILLMIVFGSAILVSFLYFISKNDNPIPGVKRPVPATVKKEKPVLPVSPYNNSKSLSDSINISSQTTPRVITASKKNSIKNPAKQDTASAALNKPVDVSVMDNSVPSAIKYTVIQKAYFHNQPDNNTRRKAFIIHWNKAVLNPIEERNGFIYIEYTNHMGQTSRGWLNKNDLRPIR